MIAVFGLRKARAPEVITANGTTLLKGGDHERKEAIPPGNRDLNRDHSRAVHPDLPLGPPGHPNALALLNARAGKEKAVKGRKEKVKEKGADRIVLDGTEETPTALALRVKALVEDSPFARGT